nr:MAG TPA: hypothetical protein [Caudoviricetes sp.]
MSKKLTQEEAERLINMLKNSLVSEIAFPEKGTAIEFDAIGSTKQDHFTTRIYRGRINSTKYEIGARIKKDGIMLLELHINPGKVHINPDGEKIIGSHWHIYTEEFGRKQAFPAEDLQSDLFVKNTLLFMEKFNIIEKPTVNFQLELL